MNRTRYPSEYPRNHVTLSMPPFPSQTRRQFLSASASAASLAVLSPFVSANSTQANSRLRLAQIGVGGRGRSALTALQNEQYVAFCDVDEQRGRTETQRGEQTRPILEKFSDARWFKDYRQMFDRMADQIDGVVVSTPDHSHFPAAMAAIAAGKHVFVEKPLCRCVQEVRRLQAAARAKGVVTQMGNQGRAAEGIRLAREWIAAGLIGEVHTVHAWTDRPRMPWFHPARFDPDVPETAESPPPTLDWDLWLGPSPLRPYRPSIAPSLWRSFVDYGCGSLGDMGCHQLDAAVYALDLAAPESIEAASSEVFPKTFPDSSTIGWKFAGTARRAPVEVRWFDGALRPPQPVPGFKHNEGGGSLFYGTKGILSVGSHSANARLLPESRMQELASALPPKSIPRVQGGPFVEWARAIRGGPASGSNFDYAANLTELVLLGVVALRARGFLQWDSAGMRFPNRPDADRFLLPGHEYRPGWSI